MPEAFLVVTYCENGP